MFTSTAAAAAVCCYAVALVAIVVSNVHTVESIQCFVCNSHNDTACAQEALPEYLKTECSKLNYGVPEDETKNYTLCRKTIQTIEKEVNGLKADKNRIIRTCGWDDSNYKDKCYHRSGFGGKQDVCTCSTDFCNAAGKAGMNVMFASALSAAVLLVVSML
ncbi:uncharacterized protein LOC126842941 [Adelges cooleyi]|uniref:uncharacterized protein LOC126842941 n=1 Tax=Adelges cooleyi TaxID=133065 RepID=UPI0021803730|nr:uncharacterized protein LOC126842941 [Adelges cooleyi]